MGAYRTEKQGAEFVFSCPKCHHEKLYLNPKKKVFNCMRCGYKGTLGQILKDLNIAPWTAIAVVSIDKPVQIITQEFKIPGFVKYDRTWICSTMVYRFLHARNCPLIVDGGWGFSTNNALKWRLIIPIVENGITVSYVARAVDGSQPKELSGPNRSWHLYNIDEVKRDEPVVLVEGIFDCEAVRRAGFIACAIMGSSISDTQVGKLLAKAPSKIILMLDGDRAGLEGAVKAYKKLLKRTHTPIMDMSLTDDIDPDEIPTEKLSELIRAALQSV